MQYGRLELFCTQNVYWPHPQKNHFLLRYKSDFWHPLQQKCHFWWDTPNRNKAKSKNDIYVAGWKKSDLYLSADFWENWWANHTSRKLCFWGVVSTHSVYRTAPGSHIALHFQKITAAVDWKGKVIFNNIQLQYDLCCNCICYIIIFSLFAIFFPQKWSYPLGL